MADFMMDVGTLSALSDGRQKLCPNSTQNHPKPVTTPSIKHISPHKTHPLLTAKPITAPSRPLRCKERRCHLLFRTAKPITEGSGTLRCKKARKTR